MAMMVVMAMMPAVPPMMMVVAMVPPMNFRRRQPGVLLNRRGGAGIAERQRIGAFDWRGERKQRANGSKSQNFRELHKSSPWIGCHVCVESLAATLHTIWGSRLE
ncbi:hypothetical protein [Bradyrhizobium lablabi]|uniref:hypothetical protein n=1 Tax=Bradyrhizobium lablabi TaxID=722472 RepID=UPI0012E3AA17